MLTRPLTALLLATLMGLAVAGCDNDGPVEEAGEDVDRALERGGEQIEEAGDKVEDAADR